MYRKWVLLETACSPSPITSATHASKQEIRRYQKKLLLTGPTYIRLLLAELLRGRQFELRGDRAFRSCCFALLKALLGVRYSSFRESVDLLAVTAALPYKLEGVAAASRVRLGVRMGVPGAPDVTFRGVLFWCRNGVLGPTGVLPYTASCSS